MLKKRYDIVTLNSPEADWGALIRLADTSRTVLRMVFFGGPVDEAEYLRDRKTIDQELSKVFGDAKPVFSYVAQKPFGYAAAMEVTSLDGGDNAVDLQYGKNHIIADSGDSCEILIGAVQSKDLAADYFTQSQDVFSDIGKLFYHTGFRPVEIYRQWNYIARITEMDGERQHYQDFNDSRSMFYSNADWSGGYPAATGIGSAYGGVSVEADALIIRDTASANIPIDNQLQVSAHRYSQQVLLGEKKLELDNKTTPKFERARMVGKEGDYRIYISGTAAIRGEDSLIGVGVGEQTRITMENIDWLISDRATGLSGYASEYLYLRVYIKYPEDYETVREYMEKHHTGIPKLYLHADICRPELLVEIEGVASLTKITSK